MLTERFKGDTEVRKDDLAADVAISMLRGTHAICVLSAGGEASRSAGAEAGGLEFAA